MSKHYREVNNLEMEVKTSKEMRTYCQRPGKMDKNGNPVYFTEQAHKDQCDINQILRKYDKTGLITHVSKMEGTYGNLTGMDFKEAMDLVINANRMFKDLPSEIRKRFNQSPQDFLAFMEDPNNREEAIELGMINPSWSVLTDGLGEHVPEGSNVIADPEVDRAPGEPPE